jgi:hypothetical protein
VFLLMLFVCEVVVGMGVCDVGNKLRWQLATTPLHTRTHTQKTNRPFPG